MLAGFTLTGGELGLWEPVNPLGDDPSGAPMLERRDSNAASGTTPPAVVHSKPSPPVSVRLALLIALGAFALRVLPPRCLWLLRQLEDYAWSLRERGSRPGTGRANLAFASQPGTNLGRSGAPPPLKKPKEYKSSPPKPRISAVARPENLWRSPSGVRNVRTRVRRACARTTFPLAVRVIHRERPRLRRAFAGPTPVRKTSVRAFLYEFRDDVVIVTLAVILAATVGVLTVLYAS